MRLNERTARFLLIGLIIVGLLGWGYTRWQRWQASKAGLTIGLLSGEPCAPPCWQGFTPGTVVDKATVLRRLRRMPGIDTVWERELPISVGGVEINWKWERKPPREPDASSWQGYNYNNILLSDGDVLKVITLSLDFRLTVAELIDQYGIPPATGPVVPGTPTPGSASMLLFYPQEGMMCRVEVLPDFRPVLKPDSIVYEVIYYPRDSDLDLAHTLPWPGYGELDLAEP